MNKYKKRIEYSYENKDIVVQEVKKAMSWCQVFTLTGPLGAGKTTITKAILESCGVSDPVTSPTFNYVNEYTNDQEERFFHFDLYRIGSIDNFLEQGFDEYLYQSNSWSFIEWSEIIKPLLTHDVCSLSFDYHKDSDKRVVEIEYSKKTMNDS